MTAQQQEPAPLVPPEVDLRGCNWMPYFGDYLRGSEFNARATDAEWRAAHNLWWAAWRQVPAASLPDEDDALARFADFGRDVKAWKKVKAMATHGFVRCSDGRLYHRFLSKEALKAWAIKQQTDVERESERRRKQEWRDRKKKKRDAAEDGGTETGMSHGTSGGPDQGRDADVPSNTVQNRTEQNTTTPNPSGEPSPERVVVDAFLRIRGEAYPSESRLPAPTMTLEAQARSFLDEGAPRDLLVEVIDRETRKLAAQNEPVPQSLAAFNRSIPAAISRHKRAGERPQGANGHAPADPRQSDIRTENWPQRLKALKDRGTWIGTWGPKPGEPGCYVPTEILKAHGYAG